MPQVSLRSRHIVITVVQLGLLGLTVGLVATGHGRATGHGTPFRQAGLAPSPGVTSGPAGPAPPPPAFEFTRPQVFEVASGSHNRKGARSVAADIAGVLSGFYDQAFVQARLVAGGPPEAVWSAFASSIQDRARKDSKSLAMVTPGPSGPLSVTQSKLTVWVLLDPRGRPQAAVATVAFKGHGSLATGEALQVTNRTRMVLRPSGSGWIVVAYPRARTSVSAASVPSPAPSPSVSGTNGTPGPSPSPVESPS